MKEKSPWNPFRTGTLYSQTTNENFAFLNHHLPPPKKIFKAFVPQIKSELEKKNILEKIQFGRDKETKLHENIFDDLSWNIKIQY